ncbi:hypothetical protein D3C84_578800 [compost metagenome]
MLKQRLILRVVDHQLLTGFPGTRQVADGQSHMESLQRDLRVIRLQNLPLLEHLLCQLKTLVRYRDINPLFQPGNIGLRIGQLR